jgi:hypothetical protein
MRITRADMTRHISAGRAQPWTHTLHGLVPTATLLDGTWYVVLDGDADYQPAPERLAATLTQTDAALTTANRHLTKAPAQP